MSLCGAVLEKEAFTFDFGQIRLAALEPDGISVREVKEVGGGLFTVGMDEHPRPPTSHLREK